VGCHSLALRAGMVAVGGTPHAALRLTFADFPELLQAPSADRNHLPELPVSGKKHAFSELSILLD